MEDVASGASWPEDLWFNEHHLDSEIFSTYDLLNCKEICGIHVTLEQIFGVHSKNALCF